MAVYLTYYSDINTLYNEYSELYEDCLNKGVECVKITREVIEMILKSHTLYGAYSMSEIVITDIEDYMEGKLSLEEIKENYKKALIREMERFKKITGMDI